MATSNPPEVPTEEGERGYEAHDLSVRGIAWFGAGIFLMIIVSAVVLVWLYGAFNAAQPQVAQPAIAVVEPTPSPQAALQANPASNLQVLRARENAILNSYGWVDKQAGIARIPIDRAIDLLAQEGLPTGDSGAQQGSSGNGQK
jgi:hypothetical protein